MQTLIIFVCGTYHMLILFVRLEIVAAAIGQLLLIKNVLLNRNGFCSFIIVFCVIKFVGGIVIVYVKIQSAVIAAHKIGPLMIAMDHFLIGQRNFFFQGLAFLACEI